MQVLKLLLSSTFFLFLFLSNINSETITVKCYIDKEKSYSFLINKEKKEVLWLDQNNQKLIITVFPDLDKGGNLIIMAGTDSKKEKYTFILNTTKAIISIVTNLGNNKSGKCGNKSIFEAKDIYKE